MSHPESAKVQKLITPEAVCQNWRWSILGAFTNYFMAGITSSMNRHWEHPYLVDGPKTKMYRRLNLGFHIAAVVVALASLCVFIAGMLEVRDALHLMNGRATTRHGESGLTA
jgi:hypothetical protein